MNYYPYKEAAYLRSCAIFETADILNGGGVIDYAEGQINGGGLHMSRHNIKQSRRI